MVDNFISDNSIAAAIAAIEKSSAKADPDFPRFHVAPPVGRLNDPNGLILKDGIYHVFHQLGPFFPTGKAIYWGHFSSRDLVNWESHAPAIPPNDWYDKNGVYSGGAIASDGQVWLHYTGNVKEEDGTRKSYQCAATTTDFESFTKLAANPLIPQPPPGYTAHVRDPFVVGNGGTYTMYLGAQRENLTGTLLVYTSSDLGAWNFAGEVDIANTKYHDFGYMWECPNVIRMPDEVTGQTFDVLLFSPQGIESEEFQFRNIFACGYLIGHLDGKTFTPVSDFIELDSGFEFYAPQVFTLPNASDRPPLLMGWIGNASEDDQPSLRNYGWVHLLSAARELRLKKGHIYQAPLFHGKDGCGVLQSCRPSITSTELTSEAQEIVELRDRRSFILDLSVGGRGSWSLTLGKDDGPHVDIRFEEGFMVVDRSATYYPHGDRRLVPIPKGEKTDVTIVHDRSITEIFIGEGHTTFSMRTYIDSDLFAAKIRGEGLVEAARVTLM